MEQIGLYYAPDCDVTPHDADNFSIDACWEPTELVTMFDYKFETEPMFGSPNVYSGRLIQFHSNPHLLGVSLTSHSQYFSNVPEKLNSTLEQATGVTTQDATPLTPVQLDADEFWAIVDDVEAHLTHKFEVVHPMCSGTLEDIACRMENTNVAAEDDMAYYFDKARDNQWDIERLRAARLPGLDTRVSICQTDGPVRIIPKDTLDAPDIATVFTFLQARADFADQ